MKPRWARVAIFLLALLPGCFVGSFEYSPIRSDGEVRIRWTIDDRADERSCPSFGATRARIEIKNELGTIVRSAEPSCDDFVSRHELDAGDYTASVSLLDDDRRVVAAPVRVY